MGLPRLCVVRHRTFGRGHREALPFGTRIPVAVLDRGVLVGLGDAIGRSADPIPIEALSKIETPEGVVVVG
jgi:hypothetical protein